MKPAVNSLKRRQTPNSLTLGVMKHFFDTAVNMSDTEVPGVEIRAQRGFLYLNVKKNRNVGAVRG